MITNPIQMRSTFFIISLLLLLCIACTPPPPPESHGPLPSEAQLAWHDMQFYMFVHFNMNTFTNMEWGMGDESPASFNPTALDCRQWARIAKSAGMKGIILTAKHHDGFCLWPSAFTEHSVKNSPWKNGQGDLVADLAKACKEEGLKMGVYLSPWDRNHADYGTEAYINVFRNQLRELLTQYGDVFEVWFDGANGGTGYYGGANEARKVDRKTYYDWATTNALVAELMPNALIFSDAGPGCRWVGNEEGWANKTNWNIIRRDEFYPGTPDYKDLQSGHEDGTHWVPAEVDVSIRPGWYYHPYEDHKVKPLSHLVDIYYNSIGRNSNLLLNFPVDPRGLIHPTDSARLMELVSVIARDFSTNLFKGKKAEASQVRGNASKYGAQNAIDNDSETYWTTDDGINSASLTIDLGEKTAFNRFLAQEYIRLGQRVKAFTLEVYTDDGWVQIAGETTIGYKRILRFPTVEGSKVRINITDAKACPVINHMGLFYAPQLVVEPHINRNKAGLVSISIPEQGPKIYYTLDGSEPTTSSNLYKEAFMPELHAEVKAIAYDPVSGRSSAIASRTFDIPKAKWKVSRVSSGDLEKAAMLIDDNPDTWWGSAENSPLPQEVIVDLGEVKTLRAITYLPMQERYLAGIVTNYEVYISKNGQNWGSPIKKGELSNILNSPIMQTIHFDKPQEGRYIRFRAMNSLDSRLGIAELGVLSD